MKSLPGIGSERPRKIGGFPLLPFFALLIGGACAAPTRLSHLENARLLETVPFFAQEAYQCGPASLASVLNYWGVQSTPEQIAEEIFSKGARGTLNLDMVLYAQRNGMTATQMRGSVEDLKENIDSARPIIVLVDVGVWVVRQSHYMVVIGYTPEEVVVHSGIEKQKRISWPRFLASWGKSGFWMLLLTPSSPPSEKTGMPLGEASRIHSIPKN